MRTKLTAAALVALLALAGVACEEPAEVDEDFEDDTLEEEEDFDDDLEEEDDFEDDAEDDLEEDDEDV